MAYYKALARHGASSKRQDYLERRGGDRALARDLVNIGLASDAEEWGRCMDETRRDAGNDRAWRGRRAVTYQEFILSPDPRDGVSLEQMRELALSWAEQWFGERGKLGPYQVAIVYHDDNERSITHAHVHVNNTNLDTGRRLHIDNADVRRLRLSVQGECERRGLRHFSLEEDRPGRRRCSGGKR